jgi:hypothetical protein
MQARSDLDRAAIRVADADDPADMGDDAITWLSDFTVEIEDASALGPGSACRRIVLVTLADPSCATAAMDRSPTRHADMAVFTTFQRSGSGG